MGSESSESSESTEARETLQADLFAAMADLVRSDGSDVIHNLACPLLNGGLDRMDVPPKDHPAVAHLPEMQENLLPAARPLFQALLAAAPTLAWQVSYALEDGFGEEYLQRYAWCDVIGPNGIYVSDEYRIGFGFWREGLFYPPHSHEPEEIYWVLSGTGRFTSGDAQPASKGPGSVIHHEPYEWHSIDMRDSPVLVFFLWKGANLHKLSAFQE